MSAQIHPQRSPRWRQWSPLVGLFLTLFVVSYHIGVVPPIMPKMVRELDTSMGYIQGALILIALVEASFAPTCENLSQYFGRKRIYLSGLGLFSIGVITTALSQNVGGFILCYALISGLGATPLIASPRDFSRRLYDDKTGKIAQLTLLIFSVLGGILGALGGGLIAAKLGWRWSFVPELVLIPLICLCISQLPSRAIHRPLNLDWVGGSLSFCGFSCTLLGVSLGSEYGWWQPTQPFELWELTIAPFSLSIVPTLIAIGLICLGGFAAWQRQQRAQGQVSLLRVGLLKNAWFLLGVMTAALHTLITTGIQFNLYQYLPTVLDLNPLQTAQTVIPFSLALLVSAIFSTVRFVGRLSMGFIVHGGLTLFCVGLVQLYRVVTPALQPQELLLPLVVMGVGSGLFLSQMALLAFTIAEPEQRIEAASIYNPLQKLGKALGRAVLGTMLIVIAARNLVEQASRTLDQQGIQVTEQQQQQAIATLKQVIQTYTQAEQQEFLSNLPDVLQPNLPNMIDIAAVDAMQMTLLVALIFSFMCLGLSFAIPKRLPR